MIMRYTNLLFTYLLTSSSEAGVTAVSRTVDFLIVYLLIEKTEWIRTDFALL